MTPFRTIQAGTTLAFWGQVDSLGFFAGTSGSVSQGATGEAMGRLLGIKTAAPGPVEPDFVDDTGDDSILGTFAFEPNKLPQFIMEFAAMDLNNQALLQGTLVETLGSIRLGVLQPNNPVYPDVCMIIQGRAKSKDSGSDGVAGWAGYILPLNTLVPLGRQTFQERTPGVERIKAVTQIAGKKPWGATIVDADLGTTGAPIIAFHADNPLVMERLTGNGALSTFNLTYKPVSAAKTRVFVDTAPFVPTSVSTTAPYSFTISGVPAAAAKIEVLYEFQP